MSRDKQNIKTTDWLIRGIPEAQLKREKQEAVMSAYLELCITYDEETKRIDFDATAEKMVAEGYRKSQEVAEEIFAEFRSAMRTEISRNEELFAEDEDDFYEGRNDAFRTAINCLAELKKKYTVTDTNDGCKDTEGEK